MRKAIYLAVSSAFALTPVFASAAVDFSEISDLVTQAGQIIAKLIPIMFALAIIYFFWGVTQYIRGAGDPKKASEGKSIMIYGIIGLAVMASLYGIIFWLQSTLGIETVTTITLPTVPGLGI